MAFKQLFAGNKDESQKRIDKILSRARRETGVHDVLSFGLSQMWLPLFMIGSLAFRYLHNQNPPRVEDDATAKGGSP